MPQPTLYSRCQGPNAIPVERLIVRGEKAAEAVCERYGDYLLTALNALVKNARDFLSDRGSDEKRRDFFDGLHDIRSSAATAEREWVARFATSLEGIIRSRDTFDEHLPAIIDLHLDALTVAAKCGASTVELKYLEDRLACAATALV